MQSYLLIINPSGSRCMVHILALALGLSMAGKVLSAPLDSSSFYVVSNHIPIATLASPYDYSFMAKGADPDLDAFYQGEVIAEEEMGDLRGGFNIAGMKMNFGAKINTLINDRINYETVINFSDMGAEIVSRTLNDTMQEKFASMNQTMQNNKRWMQAPNVNGTPVDRKQVFSTNGSSGSKNNAGSFNNGGVMLVSASKAQAQVAKISQGKIDVAGLADFSGVVVNDTAGGTIAALHSITKEAIVTALANTASGQNIQQSIGIKINIEQFSALKSARQRTNIMRSLSNF